MKTTKYLLGSILCLCLFCFSACEDNAPVSKGYSFGIFEYEGSIDDRDKVENYLVSKKCPMDLKAYTGKSLDDTDKKAKSVFDKAVSKLSVNEINTLDLSADCSFTYAAVRYDENHEMVYVASYSYP